MSSQSDVQSVAKLEPFVSALKGNQKSVRCDQCFKCLEKSVKCQICHKYWYCNDECLRRHNTVHEFECDSSYDLVSEIDRMCSESAVSDESDWPKFGDTDEVVTQTLLLLRLLYRLKSDPKTATNEYMLGDGRYVTYNQIQAPDCRTMHRVWDEEMIDTTCDDLKAELIDEVTYNFGAWLSVVRQILALDFIQNKLGSVPEEVLMRAFRIVVRYTLYVCDTTFIQEIGKAIYIEMCFVKHSCVPNCGPLFDGTNVLNLRLLDPKIAKWDQLLYDYQIEMTGFPAQELYESLLMRNISCDCVKCLATHSTHLLVNYQKNVLSANLKYGNWPPIDYCLAMMAPIDEALDNFGKTYGTYHPWITALLLWKTKVEWNLYNCEDADDITGEQVYTTFKRLKDAVSVTHGSGHIWFIKLNSIDKTMRQLVDSKKESLSTEDVINVIESTIEQIIPQTLIDQKLA